MKSHIKELTRVVQCNTQFSKPFMFSFNWLSHQRSILICIRPKFLTSFKLFMRDSYMQLHLISFKFVHLLEYYLLSVDSYWDIKRIFWFLLQIFFIPASQSWELPIHQWYNTNIISDSCLHYPMNKIEFLTETMIFIFKLYNQKIFFLNR